MSCSPQNRPNILLLFTDQQRFDTISALGNPIIKTPNLDRLVQEGTTFEKCYSPCPVCMPARHALASGLPPHVTQCVDNHSPKKEYPSFMEKLQQAGYQTHGVGKMHFSPKDKLWGFQTRDTSEENEADCDHKRFIAEKGYEHVHAVNGLRSEYYYLPQPSQLPSHLHETHWVADRSIDFLENRKPDQPFFLWSSFIKPHPPFESPYPWSLLYRSADMPAPFTPNNSKDLLNFWNQVQNRYKYMDDIDHSHLRKTIIAAYYACISFIDYNVGRIFQTLGDEIDNTLILFSSDHGELLGDYNSVGKRCMLEPAARVPLLARWPQKFKAGERVKNPTTLLDIYPTVLSAAGVENPSAHEEGQNLHDVAKGKSNRQYVFSQFSENRLGLYMVTEGEWKYIYSAADEKEWLFQLEPNSKENENRIEDPSCQKKRTELKQALIQRFKSDNYETVLHEDDFLKFGKTPFPKIQKNSKETLLFQDPPEIEKEFKKLGPYQPEHVVEATEGIQFILDLIDYASKKPGEF